MAKAKKSAFVSALASSKEALAEAAEKQRNQLTDTSEILKAFNLTKENQRVSLQAQLISVKSATYEDGDNKGLPYVNWLFSPTDAPGKGMTLSNNQPGFDRKTKEISGSALGWIFIEFQACGFDTSSWAGDPSQIEEAATELNKEKPIVMLGLRTALIKTGPRQGQLAVNMSISRILDASDLSSQEEPEVEGEVDDEPTIVPAVVPDVEPATTVTKTKGGRSKAPKAYAVGDKVKFEFQEEEGAPKEVLTGSITGIDDEGGYEVFDGKYTYNLIVSDFI